MKYSYQNRSLKNIKGEKWEDIPGLDGYYCVSNFGRVKRERRESVNSAGILKVYKEMIIAPRIMRTANNYVSDLTYQLGCNVTVEGKQYCMSIRRLVYYCFVTHFNLNDEAILIVSKNGNGLDIRPKNLLAVNRKEFVARIIEQKRTIPEFRVKEIHKIGALAAKKVTSKQVTQYDKKGRKIKTYPSAMEAYRQTGISNSSIANAATGFEPTAHGYFWAYGNSKFFDVKTFLDKRKIGFKKKRGTKVTQYNFKGERVAKYLTLTDAANAVNAQSYISISHVIKGKARSALGYFWKKGWGKKKIKLNNYQYGHISSAINRSKKVRQYSLNGKPLKTFNSITEAAKKFGIRIGAISYALKSKSRTAAGFKWKYANEK